MTMIHGAPVGDTEDVGTEVGTLGISILRAIDAPHRAIAPLHAKRAPLGVRARLASGKSSKSGTSADQQCRSWTTISIVH